VRGGGTVAGAGGVGSLFSLFSLFSEGGVLRGAAGAGGQEGRGRAGRSVGSVGPTRPPGGSSTAGARLGPPKKAHLHLGQLRIRPASLLGTRSFCPHRGHFCLNGTAAPQRFGPHPQTPTADYPPLRSCFKQNPGASPRRSPPALGQGQDGAAHVLRQLRPGVDHAGQVGVRAGLCRRQCKRLRGRAGTAILPRVRADALPPLNQRVVGSSPTRGTLIKPGASRVSLPPTARHLFPRSRCRGLSLRPSCRIRRWTGPPTSDRGTAESSRHLSCSTSLRD
jgi:hypothetical protein